MAIRTNIFGQGLGFPPRVGGDGRLYWSAGEQNVRESIRIILLTEPGERLMRPDFGCEIHSLVFAQNNTGTAGLARFYVEEALTRWEPRIDLLEVEVHGSPQNPAELLIGIEYVIKETDSRFNMVFPFYLTRGPAA